MKSSNINNSEMNLNNQEGYFNPLTQGLVPVVVGVGAAGSWAIHNLARLGLSKIKCYDNDVIEAKNNQNQAFHTSDVGKLKVNASAEYFERFGNINPIEPFAVRVEKVEDLKLTKGEAFALFLLTDSTQSRLDIAKMVEKNPDCKVIIETRLTLGEADIYCFSPNQNFLDGKYDKWKESLAELRKTIDSPEYEKSLETSPCGNPLAIGTTACITGAMAVNTYVEFCRMDEVPPFFRSYFDTRNMITLIEED